MPVSEILALESRAVDRRAGVPGERSNSADVVDVGVRDEDRLDRDAERFDRLNQALRLIARIDQERPGRAMSPRDIGVLREGADGERADVERNAHLAACLR